MLCRFVLLKLNYGSLEEEWAFINFNVFSFTINHLGYSSLQQVPSKIPTFWRNSKWHAFFFLKVLEIGIPWVSAGG